MRIIVLALLVGSVASAGCLDEEGDLSGGQGQEASSRMGASVSFTGNGQWTGEIDSKQVECDTDGHVSLTVNGQGTLHFQVLDGNGTTIAEDEFSGQGQDAFQHDLMGDAGVWEVRLTAGNDDLLSFGGYQGQYAGQLNC